MRLALLVAGVGVVVVVLTGGLSRLVETYPRVSPRIAGGAYLVSLLSWVLFPVLWLACLGSGLGALIGGTGVAGGCHVSAVLWSWALFASVPGALLLGALGFHLYRQVRVAGGTEARDGVLSRAVRRPTSAGDVWVVPSGRPAAFVSGWWRCRAIVTSGLLARLSRGEREAVCEHEVAHLRLGLS